MPDDCLATANQWEGCPEISGVNKYERQDLQSFQDISLLSSY